MKTKVITRVNNVDIIATNDEQLIAIRSICDALGIDYSTQLKKIKEDDDLAATVGYTTTVAKDGKEREMACLPIRYIFGWLFTINPANVKPEAQDAVRSYRKSCYNVLYDYFFKRPLKQLEQNKIEINLLEEIADIKQAIQTSKTQLSAKQRLLEQLREERLKNEPELF